MKLVTVTDNDPWDTRTGVKGLEALMMESGPISGQWMEKD